MFSVVCLFDAFDVGHAEFFCSKIGLEYSVRQGTVDVGP